ncbi:MAG: replication-associated recombination protein A [Desulfobulbaceae bacterium]|nr:replication-associated recombination protein A [Desulfobulbaceae bacterium]
MAVSKSSEKNVPLAERMRPRHLADFIGQNQLLGEDKLLWRLVRQERMPSLLLWGPPGVGKTTLAHILANQTKSNFVFFSAVLSGIKDVREIVVFAEKLLTEKQQSTILFVDEIHRFNKSQQDAFLPHVESGLLTLIGATTENPSFQVIAPLLSRCRVLVLNPLSKGDLTEIINRAIKDPENGLGKHRVHIEPEALDHLAEAADGDARRALNNLEVAFSITNPDGDRYIIDAATVEEAIQHRSLRYDTDGEEHYNLISALHKSMRDSDPDGALYWLTRMIISGEDPLYIARRLIRFASEDIGNADPQALALALNARESFHILGSPEGELAIAQATIYLATAPKSNATYSAFNQVSREIKKSGSLPVPKHIRNAPTALMKELGYGKGYKYAHDQPEGIVLQNHLPDELEGRKFYHPTNRGHEAVIADRLRKWHKILDQRAADANPKEKRKP